MFKSTIVQNISMIFGLPKTKIKAKEGRLLQKDRIEEIGETKTQLFIALILIP